MNYHLRLMGELPMPPADADFSLKIDFKKGEGDPRRVFDAAGRKQLDRRIKICEITPLARNPFFEVVNVTADFSALEAKS